jgi:hypothetical protein
MFHAAIVGLSSFARKIPPLQGNLELSAKVARSARNLKNFGKNPKSRTFAKYPCEEQICELGLFLIMTSKQ